MADFQPVRKVMKIRQWMIVVTGALVGVAVLAVVGSAFEGWQYGLPTHDRTVLVNTVAAVAAFILVAWGVVVALAAYVSATGTPDLSVELTFRYPFPNEPVFSLARDDEIKQKLTDEHQYIGPYRQAEGQMMMKNSSKYAARNPGVRIRLDGLGGVPPQAGWTVVAKENMVGTIILQWDGGADYIIHGEWSRMLPALDVRGMYAFTKAPAFIIEFAADGFGPKTLKLPVKILGEADYAAYSTRRNERVMKRLAAEKGQPISRLRLFRRPNTWITLRPRPESTRPRRPDKTT